MQANTLDEIASFVERTRWRSRRLGSLSVRDDKKVHPGMLKSKPESNT